MTFVIAMFAATVGLVWFGYVATRDWRSGTNLLVEQRANEALALVRAGLRADMKGAWITAIVGQFPREHGAELERRER